MTDQIILTQLQLLPEALQKEVMDFIGYLLEKHRASAKPVKPTRQNGINKAEKGGQAIAEAIKIVQAGCDMRSFGDALEYQKTARQDRELPYRD